MHVQRNLNLFGLEHTSLCGVDTLSLFSLSLFVLFLPHLLTFKATVCACDPFNGTSASFLLRCGFFDNTSRRKQRRVKVERSSKLAEAVPRTSRSQKRKVRKRGETQLSGHSRVRVCVCFKTRRALKQDRRVVCSPLSSFPSSAFHLFSISRVKSLPYYYFSPLLCSNLITVVSHFSTFLL